MKPPVARKLAVRHTSFKCLTASFLATLIISKCMHGLHITVAAFRVYILSVVKMPLKWNIK